MEIVYRVRKTVLKSKITASFGNISKTFVLISFFLLPGCDQSSGQEGDESRTALLDAGSFATVDNPEGHQLTQKQENLLTLINLARSEPRVCGELGEMPAVRALSWNSLLEISASNTVDDMAAGDYFAHQNPQTLENGAARISAVGYAYQRWGENLDAGYSNPEVALEALLQSPTHCQILMRPYWNEVAWSRRQTPEHSTYSILGAQHFGTVR